MGPTNRPIMVSMKGLVSILLLVPTIALAQSTLQKPAAGSPLRKAILDALRPNIEKDVGQKVVFIVSALRVYQGWAYVACRPVKPDLKPIDFMKTKYKQALLDGVFDGDSTYALLKQSKGKWVVKTFVIGPTDVAWSNWMEEPYYAPKTLFPPPFGPK